MSFTPNQLNWPTLRGKHRAATLVMLPGSILYVSCDADIQRSVLASNHVARPLALLLIHGAQKTRRLFHFFVRRVLPARIAKLRRLKPFRVLLPVLHGRVVSVFALATLQCDDFAHQLTQYLHDLVIQPLTNITYFN